MPLKGSLSRPPAFSGDSSPLRIPPGSTSPGSFSRPPTPMHFSGQIPHQVTLGAQRESSSPTLPQSRLPGLLPGAPRGIQRTLPSTPASSLLSISQLRRVPGTHPPTCSNSGALHWGVGGVEKRRKTSPSPTPGWTNQRGSIPEGRGGGLGLCKAAAEIPVRGRQRQQETGKRLDKRPGKQDPEMGEGAQRDLGRESRKPGRAERDPGKERRDPREGTQRPGRAESRGKEHRDPAREDRETPGGVADGRETPGLLGGWNGLKVGGRDTGRQRYRGSEGRRETETRREKEK